MSLVKTGYCPAGACYHYSNTNYVILGRIAEVVGGAPVHEQLRERFFEPLGSRHGLPAGRDPAARCRPRSLGLRHRLLDHTRDARLRPFMAAVTAADAAGAIASTARDLSVWAAALYGGEVLSPASLAEMTTMLAPRPVRPRDRRGRLRRPSGVGHRGGLRGFEASHVVLPRTKRSLSCSSRTRATG